MLHTPITRDAPQPWHQLPEARAILRDMSSNPPAIHPHDRAYVLTSDEWLAYDESDPRYERLNELAGVYLAPFLASTAACRDGRTAAAMDCSIDQAIDAVQAGPMLFNLNDEDERKTWLHLRLMILGGLVVS